MDKEWFSVVNKASDGLDTQILTVNQLPKELLAGKSAKDKQDLRQFLLKALKIERNKDGT